MRKLESFDSAKDTGSDCELSQEPQRHVQRKEKAFLFAAGSETPNRPISDQKSRCPLAKPPCRILWCM